MSQHYTGMFTFHCSAQDDTPLRVHTGERCLIVRPLRDGTEVDEAEVGRMYVVRFKDGTQHHVFEDELS